MDGWLDGQKKYMKKMDGWMDKKIDGWLDGSKKNEKKMDGWMDKKYMINIWMVGRIKK